MKREAMEQYRARGQVLSSLQFSTQKSPDPVDIIASRGFSGMIRLLQCLGLKCLLAKPTHTWPRG